MISLVALGVVLRGLYFFSAGGLSPGRDEVLRDKGVEVRTGPKKRP